MATTMTGESIDACCIATAISTQLNLLYGQEVLVEAAAIKLIKLGVESENVHRILHDLMDGIKKLSEPVR